METRRSKRKEAAASDPTPSEPRNKKARRANADSKSKAGVNRKQKSQSATASASAEPDTAQAVGSAVHKASLDPAPTVAPSVAAEVSTSTAQEPQGTEVEETAAEKAIASHKEASEAQERATMDQASITQNLAHTHCYACSNMFASDFRMPSCRKGEQLSCLEQHRPQGKPA